MSTDLNEFGKRPAIFDELGLELAEEMNVTVKIQPEFAKDEKGYWVVDQAFIAKFMAAEHLHPVLQHVVKHVENLTRELEITSSAFSNAVGDYQAAEGDKAFAAETIHEAKAKLTEVFDEAMTSFGEAVAALR